MKTLEQWQNQELDFDGFCKAGDEVDEKMYWYFLEILPPAFRGRGGFLIGEPYDHNAKGEPVYAAFIEYKDGRFFYGGHRTIQEFRNDPTGQLTKNPLPL